MLEGRRTDLPREHHTYLRHMSYGYPVSCQSSIPSVSNDATACYHRQDATVLRPMPYCVAHNHPARRGDPSKDTDSSCSLAV